MAKKKETDESVIVTAAKAIGEAAGKVAVIAGVTAPEPKPAKVKIEKLKAKNKARLPRKEKKAQKKKAAAAK